MDECWRCEGVSCALLTLPWIHTLLCDVIKKKTWNRRCYPLLIPCIIGHFFSMTMKIFFLPSLKSFSGHKQDRCENLSWTCTLSAKKGQSSIHKFPGGATVKKNMGKTSGWGGRSSIPMVFCVLINEEAKCFLGLFHSWASVFSRPGGANSLRPVAPSPKSCCVSTVRPEALLRFIKTRPLHTSLNNDTQPHNFTIKEKLSEINHWN